MTRWTGRNTKSQQAQQRINEALTVKANEMKRMIEDAKWVDNDKQANAKLNRKASLAQKAEEKSMRKAEVRSMLAEEESKLASLSAKPSKHGNKQTLNPKLTRADIAKRVLESLKREKQLENAAPPSYDDEIPENPNLIYKEELKRAQEDNTELIYASGLNDTINSLNAREAPDLHVERRMKAAYNAYEATWLPKLKEENPSLKRSQLKMLVWQQWKKAPENPMNKF